MSHSEHPPWTVICPSGSDENLPGFVYSLLEFHPEILPDQIVIVSNRLARNTRKQFPDLTWVKGAQPFIFARNVNMGVQKADPLSDLVIMGDDVRFTSENALDRLALQARDAAAVAAAVMGVCGQPAQRIGSARDVADWLAFICVYIRRGVWDTVGQLDERFIGYGYEDVDWCVRSREHGELRVIHDVVVEHLPTSKWRSDDSWQEEYKINREIFEEKWGPKSV